MEWIARRLAPPPRRALPRPPAHLGLDGLQDRSRRGPRYAALPIHSAHMISWDCAEEALSSSLEKLAAGFVLGAVKFWWQFCPNQRNADLDRPGFSRPAATFDLSLPNLPCRTPCRTAQDYLSDSKQMPDCANRA